MCPKCSLCGDPYEDYSIDEGYLDEINGFLLCHKCNADLRSSLGVSSNEDKIESLSSDIDETINHVKKNEEKIEALENLISKLLDELS